MPLCYTGEKRASRPEALEDDVKIRESKIKTALLLLFIIVIFLGFVFFALYDLFLPTQAGGDDSPPPLVFRVFCGLLAPILLVPVFFLAWRLGMDEPLLEINERALIDRSSLIAMGEIRFADIERIGVKGDFIVISLKDPARYLERLGPVARLLIRANRRLGYECVCISLQTLGKQASDFLEELNKRFPIHIS